MNRLVASLFVAPVLIIAAGIATSFWKGKIEEKVLSYERFRNKINEIEHYSKLSKLELLKIHNRIVLNFTEISLYAQKADDLIAEIRESALLDADETLYFKFENFAAGRLDENASINTFKAASALHQNAQSNFAEQSIAVLEDLASRPRLDAEGATWLRAYADLERKLQSPIPETDEVGEEISADVRRAAARAASIENLTPMAQSLASGRQAIRMNGQIRRAIDDVFSAYHKEDYLSLLRYVDSQLAHLASEAQTRKLYLAACIAFLCITVLAAIALLLRALGQLRHAKATLEERVAERTRALLQKSSELETHKEHLEEEVQTRTRELNRKAQELLSALIKEQQYSKLQKDFVSMISHEFRTPVAIIDMAAQRLTRKKSKTLDSGALEEFADGIRKNTRRLTGLIDRTLTSSRFREGRLDFTPEQISLTELITQICAQQEKLHDGCTIHTLIDPDIPDIIADHAMIEQIFTNLIGNAAKYSPEKTPVVVRVQREEDFVRVDVIDQGIGIPDSELPKLFERYFRASNARVIAGTGLGLSITKEMIELHGGSLRVVTEENKGSAFMTLLPIAGPAEAGIEEAPQQDVA